MLDYRNTLMRPIFLRAGSGPPGVLFYKRFLKKNIYIHIFLKFIFEPKPLFSRSALNIHWGSIPLVFQKIVSLRVKK